MLKKLALSVQADFSKRKNHREKRQRCKVCKLHTNQWRIEFGQTRQKLSQTERLVFRSIVNVVFSVSFQGKYQCVIIKIPKCVHILHIFVKKQQRTIDCVAHCVGQ